MENSSDKEKGQCACSESAPGNKDSSNGTCCVCKIDYKFILERARQILVDPKGCWKGIKEEPRDIKKIYFDYLAVMAAVPVLCSLIGTRGISFFSTLIFHIAQYAVSLAMFFVFGLLAAKLAGIFGSQCQTINGFKLVAYSATPSFVAGILALFGPNGAMLGSLIGLYSVYVLYQGITEMTGVSEDKRLKYTIALAVSILVLTIIVGAVIAALFLTSSIHPMPVQYQGNLR